ISAGSRWGGRSGPTGFFFFDRLALATLHLDQAIHGRTRINLFRAVRPNDLDDVHALDGAQAEMGARIIAGQITLTRLDQTLPAPRTGHDLHLSADGVSAA